MLSRLEMKLGNYGGGLHLQKIVLLDEVVLGLEVGVAGCLLWLKLLLPHFGANISAVSESQVFIAFGIGLQVSDENMRSFVWISQNIREKVIPRFFQSRNKNVIP